MSALVVTKTSPTGQESVEVNLDELTLRLQSLEKECTIEVVQLAITSMLEEIEEVVDYFPEG